jgi:hypothetical protein
MKYTVRAVLLLCCCAVVTAQQPVGKNDSTLSRIVQETTESKISSPVTAGHPVSSLKDVKALYIEPMADDLDSYLKAEFSKKLAGRIRIVLNPNDATP